MAGYEWDESKRGANLEKHGFDFLRAHEVLEGEHYLLPGRGGDEIRHVAIGRLGARLVAVVFTLRGEKTRIISIRAARHEEKRQYRLLFD